MIVALAAALLGGCEGTREMLGMGKTAPDEFAVYSRAPLSMPPNYGLRPPAPGKARPQSEDTRVMARDAMLGGRAAGRLLGSVFGHSPPQAFRRAAAPSTFAPPPARRN